MLYVVFWSVFAVICVLRSDLTAAPYNEVPENPVLQTVPVQIWSLLRSVVSVWTFHCAGKETDPETQN